MGKRKTNIKINRLPKEIPDITQVIREIEYDIHRCPACNSVDVKLLKTVSNIDSKKKDIYNTVIGGSHLFYKYFKCNACGFKFTDVELNTC